MQTRYPNRNTSSREVLRHLKQNTFYIISNLQKERYNFPQTQINYCTFSIFTLTILNIWYDIYIIVYIHKTHIYIYVTYIYRYTYILTSIYAPCYPRGTWSIRGPWVSQAKVDPSVMLRTKILATKAKDQRKASTTNLRQVGIPPLGMGGPRP